MFKNSFATVCYGKLSLSDKKQQVLFQTFYLRYIVMHNIYLNILESPLSYSMNTCARQQSNLNIDIVTILLG